MSLKHDVIIKNDFGSVTWTEKHEEAYRLLEYGADCLELTLAEFVESLRDRHCPHCEMADEEEDTVNDSMDDLFADFEADPDEMKASIDEMFADLESSKKQH